MEVEELSEPWILFTDGSFEATNNEAEYETLIAGLRIAEEMGVKNLQANVDSRLVANQVNGTYIAKEADMFWYLEKKKLFQQRPWLRCVGQLQSNYVLREIHEGSCSMHVGTRFVVAKALLTGYSWPTMHKDARELKRACQDYQGIDIAGPFSKGPGKVKLLIVAIDYFTKWIEAKPVATITAIREVKSKAKMENYYNSKVRSTSFKPGDLVYCSNDASRIEEVGKLGPKWKGPYEVTKALGNGACKLRDRDEKQLPRTWNIRNLKKCYVHQM
nr:reverse transcriptase domain-containing protein [Tanacetum cinerariifolium]